MKLLAFDQDDESVLFEWGGSEVVARLERFNDGSWWLRRPNADAVFIQRPGVLQPANRALAHGMVSAELADKLTARSQSRAH